MLGRLFRLFASLGVLVALLGVFRPHLCRWLGCVEERITIATPAAGTPITSPLTVSGRGSATQHNQLSIEVRDASNVVIGSGTAAVTGPLGQPGPFTGTVTFLAGAPGSPAHVQVFDTSPATGAVTHLASVLVTF